MKNTRLLLFTNEAAVATLEKELSSFHVDHKHFAARLIEQLAELKGEDLLSLPGLLRSNFQAKKRRGRPPASRPVTDGDALQVAENHQN